MTAQTKRRKTKRKAVVAAPNEKTVGFWNKTLCWSLFSGLAVWLAFPPVGWWPFAWLAPFGWLRVIRMPTLDGRRPHVTIYVVGYAHWLLMTHWVSLPHWSAAIGWFFLAAYLAIYVWGFIALARWLVHRSGWSNIIAAPLAWVAMEVCRSYLLTGFALVPLSHSQVSFLPVLQIANVTGAYGISFLIMLVAAALEQTVDDYWQNRRIVWWPIALTAPVFAACIAYGHWLIGHEPSTRQARVAIIQGSHDTIFDYDRNRAQERFERAFAQYSRMTYEATSQGNVDLVVWPESMFRWFGVVEYDDELTDAGPIGSSSSYDRSIRQRKRLIQQFGTHCLMGTSTTRYHAEGADTYNTAAFYDEHGDLVGSYHKMHPVMFGEYVPFGKALPWLYSLTPNESGLSSGKEPKVFQAGDLSFAPNICFENTVPHLIRRQLLDLRKGGKTVDALVTLTNDGWFWGSSLLDVHLACGVFRAIENRIPMLIAANTGFSAHISPTGNVLQKGPRRASGHIIANVKCSESQAIYTQFGDWFGCCCALLCGVGIILGHVFPAEPRPQEIARSAHEAPTN